MVMLIGFMILLVFQLLGEILVRATGAPVPGAVAGLFLLFVALLLLRRVPRSLQVTANGLLGNLALLFVPAATAALLQWRAVSTDALAIVVALVGSTLLTMMVTGGIFLRLMRREETP